MTPQTPQPPQNNPQIGSALRHADNPEHKPDFWNRLDAALDGEDGGNVRSLSAARPPQRGRWLVLAAATLTIFGGIGLFAATRGGNDSVELEAAEGAPTPQPEAGTGLAPTPAPVTESELPLIDYSQISEPLDLGSGIALAINAEATHAWLFDADPNNPELGCEGVPANTIYAVSLTTGERTQAVDSGLGTSGSELVQGPDGRIAVIEGCEGFTFALTLGRERGAQIGDLQQLALPAGVGRVFGSGFAPDGTFWFAAGDFEQSFQIFAVSPGGDLEVVGAFDDAPAEAFAVLADGTPVVAGGGEIRAVTEGGLAPIADTSSLGFVSRIVVTADNAVILGADGSAWLNPSDGTIEPLFDRQVFNLDVAPGPRANAAIAYTESRAEGGVELFVQTSSTGPTVSLGDGLFSQPVFSADGRVLLYNSGIPGADGFELPVTRAVVFGPPLTPPPEVAPPSEPTPAPASGVPDLVYGVEADLIFGDGHLAADVGEPVTWVGSDHAGGFFYATKPAGEELQTLWYLGGDGRAGAMVIAGSVARVFEVAGIDGEATVLFQALDEEGSLQVIGVNAAGERDFDVPQLEGAQWISVQNDLVARTFNTVDEDAQTTCGDRVVVDLATGELLSSIQDRDDCTISFRNGTLSADGQFHAFIESVPFDDGPPEIVVVELATGAEVARESVPFAVAIDVSNAGSVLVSTASGFVLIDGSGVTQLSQYEFTENFPSGAFTTP